MSDKITKKDVWITVLVIVVAFVVIPILLLLVSKARQTAIHQEQVLLIEDAYSQTEAAFQDLVDAIAQEDFPKDFTSGSRRVNFLDQYGQVSFPVTENAAQIAFSTSRDLLMEHENYSSGQCSLAFIFDEKQVNVFGSSYRVGSRGESDILDRVPDESVLGSAFSESNGRQSQVSILVNEDPKAVVSCYFQSSDY
jgi:predicted nucleotidyltransferase